MTPIEQAREALDPKALKYAQDVLRCAAFKCTYDQLAEKTVRAYLSRSLSTPVDGVGAEPRVKPLEWDGDFAHTSFGLFYFLIEEDDGYLLQRYDGTSVAKSFHGLRADAIDAAQADYDKRILSALANPEAEARLRERVAEAARDVMAERRRQVEAEGWTPDHDDTYANGELAAAATCYAFTAARSPHHIHNQIWPWSSDWWKPADKRRNLVKAGALILAEIERRDRAAFRLKNAGANDDR